MIPTVRGERLLRGLSVVTAIGMFFVLVMGTLVTNSGSAMGCGGSWPLCHGQFIPEFTVKTAIEFSHRGVAGAVGVASIVLGVWLFVIGRRRPEVKILAPLMAAFVIIQAIMGGLAVIYPQSAVVLALHFGISLIAFGSIFLGMFFIFERNQRDALRDRTPPLGLTRLVWGSLLFTYVVVYLGAYMRHANASLACGDWPLCNGIVVPGLFGSGVNTLALTAVAHRGAAAIGTGLIVWTWWQARRIKQERPDLYWASIAGVVLVVLQILSGVLVVFGRLELFTTLLHGALITLLFGVQCYMALHVLPRPQIARGPMAAPRPLSDAIVSSTRT